MERSLFCALAWLLCGQSLIAKVTIELEDQPIAVKTPGFTARIEPDGCLTQLALRGIEFLAPGVSISRGSYFCQGGPIGLTNIRQAAVADGSITGKNGQILPMVRHASRRVVSPGSARRRPR